MLAPRYMYDGLPLVDLNSLQQSMKAQIEKKVADNIYAFEAVPCCICGGSSFEKLSEKDRYGLYLPVCVCRDCGLIQTNPRMTQASYNEFYNYEYRRLYGGEAQPSAAFFEDQPAWTAHLGLF